MQFQVLLLVMALGLAIAHPDGAPVEACNNLTPVHNVENKGKDSQKITVEPHQDCYKAGSEVMVNVTVENEEIEGILAVAKEEGDGTNKPVGTWETGPKLKHLACSGQSKSAITHSAELETYGPVGLVWTAPAGFNKNVIFRVTIVHHKDKYWVDRQSTALEYKVDCSDTNYTVPPYVDKKGNPRQEDEEGTTTKGTTTPKPSGAASITTLSTVSMIIMAFLAALL